MTGRANQRAAALLAAVAMFGLALAPLVHAEQHLHEAALSRKQALAVVFRLAFKQQRSPAQQEALQTALEAAFGGRGEKHQRPGHRHSHRGEGSHGSSSLEHFALALHTPAAPPAARPPAPLAQGQLFATRALLLTPHYSTPESSQGPPQA